MQAKLTYEIVRRLRNQGNNPGLIRLVMEKWKLEYPGDVWGQTFQILPFYASPELVHLWPILGHALGISAKVCLQRKPSIKRLENELDYVKAPVLPNVNGTCLFKHPRYGEVKLYLVEHVHHWLKRPQSQEQINEIYARTNM